MNIEYKQLYNTNAINQMTIDTSEEVMTERGEKIASHFGLKKDKKGYYNTAYGVKTAKGLYLSSLTMLVDIHNEVTQ
jgi:hypothetical protein